jgi:hypothetical protein
MKEGLRMVRCIITAGPFAQRLCHLAKKLQVYEVGFSYLPALGKCVGELWLASGKTEMFEADNFEALCEAIYGRLLGIRRKQIRAAMNDQEGEFCDE